MEGNGIPAAVPATSVPSSNFGVLEIFAALGRNRGMALDVSDNVVRGEIDNRKKGVVRGRLWLRGVKKPVVLHLKGNAAADIAGCLLKFRNTAPTLRMPKHKQFTPVQKGWVGRLIASKKVPVPAVPEAVVAAMERRGETPPMRLANSIYLEWFSKDDGRVVIESTDYQLTISPPQWRLSARDEQQRLRNIDQGWTHFMERVDQTISRLGEGTKPFDQGWDEHDYERFMKVMDACMYKFMELKERYGDSDEGVRRSSKEVPWPRSKEEEGQEDFDMLALVRELKNEAPPEPDPARESIDWVRNQEGEIHHPLQHRAYESAMLYWKQCRDLSTEFQADERGEFVLALLKCSTELSGALDDWASGSRPKNSSYAIAFLKRGLAMLHRSQRGLEAAAKKKLLSKEFVTEARQELFEIRAAILNLIQEFRRRS